MASCQVIVVLLSFILSLLCFFFQFELQRNSQWECNGTCAALKTLSSFFYPFLPLLVLLLSSMWEGELLRNSQWECSGTCAAAQTSKPCNPSTKLSKKEDFWKCAVHLCDDICFAFLSFLNHFVGLNLFNCYEWLAKVDSSCSLYYKINWKG